MASELLSDPIGCRHYSATALGVRSCSCTALHILPAVQDYVRTALRYKGPCGNRQVGTGAGAHMQRIKCARPHHRVAHMPPKLVRGRIRVRLKIAVAGPCVVEMNQALVRVHRILQLSDRREPREVRAHVPTARMMHGQTSRPFASEGARTSWRTAQAKAM